MNKKGFTLFEIVCATMAMGVILLAAGSFFVFNSRIVTNVQRFNERKFMARAIRDEFRDKVLSSAFVEAVNPVTLGTKVYANTILLHSHSQGSIRRYQYRDNALWYTDKLLDANGTVIGNPAEQKLLEEIELPQGQPGIFRLPTSDDVFQETGQGGWTSYRTGFRTRLITLFNGTIYYPSIEISFYPRSISGEAKDDTDRSVIKTIVGSRESMTAMFIDPDNAKDAYQDGTRAFPFKTINDYLSRGSLDCRAYVISGEHTLSSSIAGGQIGDKAYYMYFMKGSKIIFPSTPTEVIKIKGIYIYGDVEFDFNASNPCILEGHEYLDYYDRVRRRGTIYIYDQDMADMTISGLQTHKVDLTVYNQGSGNTLNFAENNTYGRVRLYADNVNLTDNMFRGGWSYAEPGEISDSAGGYDASFFPEGYTDNQDGTQWNTVYTSGENITSDGNMFRGICYFSGSATEKMTFENNNFQCNASGSLYLYGKEVSVQNNPLISGSSWWGGSVRITAREADGGSKLNVQNNIIRNMTNGVYCSLNGALGMDSQINIKNNTFKMATNHYYSGSYIRNKDTDSEYTYNYRYLTNSDAAVNVYYGGSYSYFWAGNNQSQLDYSGTKINIEANTINGYNKCETGISVKAPASIDLSKSPTVRIADNYIENIRGTQTVLLDLKDADGNVIGQEELPRAEYYEKYKECYTTAPDGLPYDGYSLGGPDAGIYINGGNVLLENNVIKNSGYNNTSVLIVDDVPSNVTIRNNQLEKIVLRDHLYSQELIDNGTSYNATYYADLNKSADLTLSLNNVVVEKQFWIDEAIENNQMNKNHDIEISSSIFEGGVSDLVANVATNCYISSIIENYTPKELSSTGEIVVAEAWEYADYNPYIGDISSSELSKYNRPSFLEPVYTTATNELGKTYKVLTNYTVSDDADKVNSYDLDNGVYYVTLSDGSSVEIAEKLLQPYAFDSSGETLLDPVSDEPVIMGKE